MEKVKRKVFINSLLFKKLDKKEKMRLNLEVLNNGLIVCDITVKNPFHEDQPIKCKALIDTGAEVTVVCQSIFDKFTLREDMKTKHRILTVAGEKETSLYPLKLFIANDWSHILHESCMSDLTEREEYDVIIGIDILKNYSLVYHGLNRLAWLEY
jgi:predicted aspartyl protease